MRYRQFKFLIAAAALIIFLSHVAIAQRGKPANKTLKKKGTYMVNKKFVIYQLLVRLFGNTNTTNKFYGSKKENGVGKFDDITDVALTEIKKLGVSYVWFTGVIEHATMTDYTKFGIAYDDPDIVKGKAGSPYAIKDYYDVDPDLATDVTKRMAEYEALIKRTHKHDLKVIMDFVPNHVARTYHSDARPKGVKDFGEDDDKTIPFSPKNEFYYIPNQSFVVPNGVDAGGPQFVHAMKDGHFDEKPAKATGNDIFKAKPDINDWYETIKLNYGVDYQNGRKTYFDPIPPVWSKMRDILVFWAKKGIDGFRCDVAEMVPVEFWSWVIPQVKKINKEAIFIGEAYDPKQYHTYLTTGKFDFLYDKVGLYDALKRLIRDDPNADVKDIAHVWKVESADFSDRMLRFLENHDEERIASEGFAKSPWNAKAAMIVSATLGTGPLMIYFGQEVGEPGKGQEGFGGEDNRTTIFDYWGVPHHQRWMNGGKFDGGGLSTSEKKLRSFYARLLNFSNTNSVLSQGDIYELSIPGSTNKHYAYLRYHGKRRLLIIANFDKNKPFAGQFLLTKELLRLLQVDKLEQLKLTDVLDINGNWVKREEATINFSVPSDNGVIISF